MRQAKQSLCAECHTSFSERYKLQFVHEPVSKGQCELCHEPHAGNTPSLLKTNVMELCKRCHTEQHTVSHPFGEGVIDPRDGSMLDCVSCHDPHSSAEEYLVYYPRERELCIQCHKAI